MRMKLGMEHIFYFSFTNFIFSGFISSGVISLEVNGRDVSNILIFGKALQAVLFLFRTPKFFLPVPTVL